MPDLEFFPQRPESHPIIYAYEHIGVESQRGYIKVGYTEKSAEKRVAEIEHTGGVPYKILAFWSAMKNDGSSFMDHDVHAILKRKGFRQLNAGEDRNEWFKCTVDDVMAAIVAVRTHTQNIENRTQTFKMRPEQETAVNMTMAYYKSAYKVGMNRTPK